MVAESETSRLGVGQLVEVCGASHDGSHVSGEPRESVGGNAFTVEDATGFFTHGANAEGADGCPGVAEDVGMFLVQEGQGNGHLLGRT